MTSRERLRETFAYGAPDRVPYFDEGLRDGVLESWRAQGLSPDADLAAMFHYDRREKVPVDLEPRPGIRKWPTSPRALARLRRRFDADRPGRLGADWEKRVAEWRTRDYVLELSLHPGFFLAMGVNDWERFEEVIYLLGDAPGVVRETLDMRAELIARMAERVLSEVEIDFASFSEPIGGNDRPLVSPRTYRELILPSYRPILDVLRRRGVKTIVLVTYANARVLLPLAIEAGFNCLWSCEANVNAMDYRNLRREFGRDLRLIAGIDLDCLLSGPEAIRREIETKVPPLLRQGGYVPIADGRVRENVTFENYRFYRRMLEKVTSGPAA